MSERALRDILVPFGWSGLVCKTLDLDPDAILDRDCPTCGGIGRVKGQYLGGTTHPRAIAIEGFATPCPDCDGTGRQPVAKVMVVPIEVADAIRDGHVFTSLVHECCTRPDPPDDERALRIGRAVLASQPKSAAIHSFFTKVVSVDLAAVGWNNARAEFLAAGEVEG